MSRTSTYSTPRSRSACSGRSPGRIALGTDRAVELVLDLQHAGGELAVVVAGANADILIGPVWTGERVLQRRRITFEAVVTYLERGLCVALVAEAAHPQRSRVREITRAFAKALQLVRTSGDETRAHCGRRAEKIQQQPRVTAKIADQREIRVVRLRARQREVVVDAGNGLHAPAVAIGQAGAIDVLRAAHVGRAVLAERYGAIAGQPAGHARAPQQLVADRAIHHLVDLGQLPQAILRIAVDAGDELELRLAEVRRDVRVGQRRAQPR